jgi:hypothetical protein
MDPFHLTATTSPQRRIHPVVRELLKTDLPKIKTRTVMQIREKPISDLWFHFPGRKASNVPDDPILAVLVGRLSNICCAQPDIEKSGI